MFNPSSPVNGTAQVGLTNPTYTLTVDQAPGPNAKQFAVTALGGTQAGVDTHSVARPFTHTMWRPLVARVLGIINALTGRVSNVPKNVYTVITRKGVTPLAGQPSEIFVIESRMAVPAGSDLADPANIRAALSSHFGLLSQQSSGIGDTTVNGIL